MPLRGYRPHPNPDFLVPDPSPRYYRRMTQETDIETMTPESKQSDMTTNAPAYSMDDLVALCKRCGFVFPASEIYGGINGFWDFGDSSEGEQQDQDDAVEQAHGQVTIGRRGRFY